MRNEEAIIERFGQNMGIEGLALEDDATALQIEEAWLVIQRHDEQLITWIQGPLDFPSKERYERILSLCDPRNALPCPVHIGLSPDDQITFGITFEAPTFTLPELERGIDVLLDLFETAQKT